MDIREALDKDLVCLLKQGDKKQALLELVGLMGKKGKIKDAKVLEQNIFYREKLMSTGIGLGIAVPHTRMEGVQAPVMAVGVSTSVIKNYESIDGEGVRIVVLIVCGSKQHKEYISLLSAVVNKLKDEKKKERLYDAGSPEELFKLLREL